MYVLIISKVGRRRVHTAPQQSGGPIYLILNPFLGTLSFSLRSQDRSSPFRYTYLQAISIHYVNFVGTYLIHVNPCVSNTDGIILPTYLPTKPT